MLTSSFLPLVSRDCVEHDRLAFVDLSRHIFDQHCLNASVKVQSAQANALWLMFRGITEQQSDLSIALDRCAMPFTGAPLLHYAHIQQLANANDDHVNWLLSSFVCETSFSSVGTAKPLVLALLLWPFAL